MSDLRERLEGWNPELPRSWKPRPGSVIVGTILRYDVGTTQYGPRHIAVLKEEETGEAVGVWLSHTVLLGEFERLRPKPGERVGIRRLDDSAKGYARYAVLVDGREPEAAIPDFETLRPGDVPPEELEAATAPSQSAEFSTAALTGDDLPF